MSKIVETALSGLREIGLEKLAKLDSICDSHLAWLAAAVGDVKRQIAETGHVAKKRRVGVDSVDNIVEESGKAVGANERRARRGRGGHKFLDTVTEENNLEEAEQKREEEPIAAPKASPAPVDKEPKPAAKVTRAKRGKKAKTEPVEETIAAPVEPIEDEPSGSQPVVAIAHVEEKPAPAKRATRRTKAAEPAAAVDIPFAPAEKPEAASTRKEEKQPVPETSRPKRGCGAKKGAAVVTKESPAVAVAPKPEPEVVPAPAAAVEEPVQEAPPVPATKRGGRKPATKSKAPAKKAATKATKPPARQQRARRGKTPAAPEEPEEVAAAPVAQQEPEVKEKLISQLPDESFMVDLSMPATQETRQKSVAQVIEKPASIEKEDETHPEAMEVEKVSNVAEAESSPLAAKDKIRGFSPAAAEALVVEEEEEEEAIVVAAAPVAAAIPAESNETATPASIRDASNVQETAGVKVEQPVLETTQLEKLEQLPEFEDDEEDMVDAVSMPAPEEEEQEDPHSPAEHVAEVDVVIREEKEEPAQKTSPIAAAADDEDEDVEEPTAAVMENGQDGVENIDEEEEEEAAGPSDGAKEHEQQGLAANLVSTIRSFLPTSKPASPAHAAKPKKHPKVKALEAAEAVRKKEEEKVAERLRQKHEAERLRQERIKTKAAAEAEAARTREEARLKREEEAAQRRKDREELEKREREEKARRLEMLKQKRKEEAAAAAAAAAAARAGAESRPAVASTSAANSLAEAKERLAKIQQQTALLAQQATKPSTSVGASLQPTRLLEPGSAAVVAAPRAAPAHAAAVPLAPSTSQRIGSSNEEAAGPQTYEISPYRSDFESDDDEPKKPVPEWARGKALVTQLVAQTYTDPDEVFQHHNKTCSLDEVFAQRNEAKGGRQDFSRRSSSGNWFEDRVTWKEELAYKKAMGYI